MIAVDTNILVYRVDYGESDKQPIARDLLRDLSQRDDVTLPWQALGEFTRRLTAWHHEGVLTRRNLNRYAQAARRLFPLAMPTPAVLDRALDLAERYSLSHWDSMLLGACADAGVTTLYTENMGAPRRINQIELVNPFS